MIWKRQAFLETFFIHPLTSISLTLYFLASGEIESTDEDHGAQQAEEERVVRQL